MEDLNKRLQATQDALATLQEALTLLQNPPASVSYKVFRDSVIKRFEYSMDTFWKYIRVYLEENQKITLQIITPKSVFRSLLHVNIINEKQFKELIAMVDDRNLTSHGYNELLAQNISKNIVNYYQLMTLVVNKTQTIFE